MISAAAVDSLQGPVADDWVLSFDLDRPAHQASAESGWLSSGRFSIFLEGWIVNRSELQGEMGLPSSSDDGAGIVSAVYERLNDAGLARLRGCFVAAVIDRERRRAVVVRDPLGTHPLYYARTPGAVLFATRPDRLLESPSVSRALNRVALADHLCLRWPNPEETFFDAVRRVPIGSIVEVAAGRVTISRSWNPLPTDGPVSWHEGDAAAAFDRAFSRSVDRCLGAGPTGIFLSGGLDSISVAAVAADQAQRRRLPAPRALSLAFPDPECDERAVQTSVAAELRMPQELVAFDDALGAGGLLPQAAALSRQLSAPALNSWDPAYLSLARRGRTAGVSTILTGLGGDEWLGVSVLHYADLLARGDVAGFVRLLSTLARSQNASPARLAWQACWTFGLRPLAGRQMSRIAPVAWDRRRARRLVRHDPAWIAPDPTVRLAQRDRAAASLGPADPPGGFYIQEMRANLEHRLVMWEMEEQYELGALAGVRFAHPYWDPDLIALLVRIPPRVLNRTRRSKGLVRETLAKRFPTLGFDRQRKVAATGFHRSLMGQECPGLFDTLHGFRGLGGLGIVDDRAARAYCVEAMGSRPERLYRVWSLLNAEAWVRGRTEGP
jgi:asparagine synthetase B (glutamine-hydrolysing)